MIAFSVNRFIFVIVIFNSDRQFKLFPTFRPGLVLLATVPTWHFSFSWKARTISMAVQCTNYIATVTIINSTELLGSIDIHHSVNLKTHLSSLCLGDYKKKKRIPFCFKILTRILIDYRFILVSDHLIFFYVSFSLPH